MASEGKEFKYGVRELAKELGVQEASARVALRNKGIPKTGKSYGWNSQDEMKRVVAKVRGDTKANPESKAPKAKKVKEAA
jgi:hypothetical protein